MKKLYIIFVLFISILCLNSVTNATERREGISSFPDSYKPYLEELHRRYPNWKFTALYTGLDWNTVIDNENTFGRSLVPKSYSDMWKNTNPSVYNIEVDAGWVDASRRAVEYAMDPRNFLNYIRIFQFENLSFDQKTNNLEGIEKILYGTEFYNRIVEYVDSLGTTFRMDKRYSDLILLAGQTSGVSCYHLASRIKQEVGPFLSHSSISGVVPGYRGLYNFYNIGATSSSEPMGAIKNGLKYARDANGASQETRDRYLIPWNNKERAITGGGIFIGSSYINRGQDTVYLQKFQVVNAGSGELYWHQYMTNILAPYSESRSIYNGYLNADLLNTNMSFIIPVYNNMPDIPVQSPNILDSDYTKDNTKVYADVASNLNIRSGPATSYEIVTTIDRNQIMTRIARGRQSGELWDMVRLSNGIVGYVFHSYLKEVPQTPERKIVLTLDGNYINGWDSNNMQASNIRNEVINQINPNCYVEIYDYRGNMLSDNDMAGTGSRIRLVNSLGETIAEYQIILYGDVNGDGKINSIDLLVLQRHILEIERLYGAFAKAGNISRNGNSPSSVDSLFIQRQILELEYIRQ